ncbi:MAG: glycosyltransferase family 2 protein [Oleiphilaceae bacterium]|nr:glycosyltransferase family 2 protein [Oleiphilaceae bacterium]
MKTNKPLASVIIPSYNCESYIEQTIKSVLNQSEQSLEILVIDDGSTDRTCEVTQSIDDKRIQLIRESHFGGPSKPRNIGLNAARGQYVFMFDSDDIMQSQKVEKSIAAMEQYPAAAFGFSNFKSIDETGQTLKESYLEEYDTLFNLLSSREDRVHCFDKEELFRPLLKANFIGTSSVVFNRQNLPINTAFNEQLKNSDDRLLWMQLARSCCSIFINESLHSYRIRENSIQTNGGLRKLENQLAAAELTLPLCSNKMEQEMLRERIQLFKSRLVKNYIKRAKLLKALKTQIFNR